MLVRVELLQLGGSQAPHAGRCIGDRIPVHRQIGTGAHSDFDCFTVLWQDPCGGLQALNSDGEWIDAAPIEGTFLINVGDMLERWTNGLFVSTVHRVINRSGRERYSCPFFYDPNVATDIAPLPGTGTPKFSPINFGDFLRGELEAAYDAHKTTP